MSYSIMEMSHSIYSYASAHGARPSLTLKAAVVHTCDDQDGALFDTTRLLEIQMASHARSAKYMTSETVSQLNDAVQRFQSGLDQCPISHPDHAVALTNLAFPCLAGCIHLQDIDTTISLFIEALALHFAPIRSLLSSTFTNPRSYAASHCPCASRAPAFVSAQTVWLVA
ncbi:hypothetical protein EDD22DRAFT_235407 [Suillus occidentalis]|nr:hypothetical protein EDD22DRAFT_235407 [Suillus occidentalis]